MYPELDEIRRESSLGGDHAKVGGQRQPKSSTDRCALNCRHHGLLARKETDGMLVERAHAAGCDLILRSMEVGARAKRLAFGRQHQRTALRLRIQCLERVGE